VHALIFDLLLVHRYKVPPDISRDYEGQYNPWNAIRVTQLSYSYAAAVLLAVDHFNQRDPSVIPELADIDESCTIYFPEPVFLDTETDRATATSALWRHAGKDQPFCAALAPILEEATLALIPLLKALQIPVMVHSMESDWLAAHPGDGAITMTLTSNNRARAMVEYLSSSIGREFLASWVREASSGQLEQETALMEALQQISEQGYDLQTFSFQDETEPIGMNANEFRKQRLEELKSSGITTIFVTIREPHELLSFAELLESLEMLNDSYIYILSPFLSPLDEGALKVLYGEQPVDSPLDRLLNGAIVFDRLDGFEFRGEDDPFLRAWKQRNEDQVTRLNELVPMQGLKADPDYFQAIHPR